MHNPPCRVLFDSFSIQCYYIRTFFEIADLLEVSDIRLISAHMCRTIFTTRPYIAHLKGGELPRPGVITGLETTNDHCYAPEYVGQPEAFHSRGGAVAAHAAASPSQPKGRSNPQG